MSNYFSEAKRKKEDKFETVEVIDDFYGKHEYAVRFDNGDIYREDAVFFKNKPTKEECTCNEDSGKCKVCCPGCGNYNDECTCEPETTLNTILKEADKEYDKIWSELGYKKSIPEFYHSQISKAYEAGQEEGLNLRKAYNDPELLNQIKQQTLKQIEEELPKKRHCELCDYPQPECSCRGYNSCLEDLKEFINKL